MPDDPPPGLSTSVGHSLPRNRGGLTDVEKEWCEIEPWLEEHGYRLRPRYRPGWIPSWRGKKNVQWRKCEDGQRMLVRDLIIDFDDELTVC